MSDDKQKRDPEEMQVQLNEAFERLEAAQSDSAREEPTESLSVPETPAARSSSPVGALALLLALIAIGVASGTAYTIWMGDGDQGELESRLDRLEGSLGTDTRVENAIERLAQLEQQVTSSLAGVEDLSTRLDEVTAGLAGGDSSADLDELTARVEQAIAGLRAEMGTSSRDWLLAEVEYLIRLGAQRVEMQRDAAGALAMFTTADEILRSAEGIAAFGLREALANDIAELQAVSTVDVDGIYVRLGALKGQVPALRQSIPDYEPTPFDASAAAADATITDRALAFLSNVGARLASLVDYRRDIDAVKPILPPKEEYYLRQNLVFQLQLAQLALLSENQAIFDNSVAEAKVWVERHFDPEDPVTQTMVSSLSDLSGLEITRDMPDVSESLRAVREMLDRFHMESQRNQVR